MTAVPTVTVKVDGVTVDAVTIADITIAHGRGNTSEQPNPASCSLTLLTANGTLVPEVGMTVNVKATVGVTDYTRFVGRVTSVNAGYRTTTVTATSDALGRLARLSGPDYRFDNNLTGVGANIDALLTATGALKGVYAVTFTYSTGDTTVLPEFVVPAGSVLAQCQALAGFDVSGVFYETPGGNLVFEDSTDRPFPNGTSADIYFNVAVSGGGDSPILEDWSAVQSLDTLTNSATVTYGRPSAAVTVTDETSVSTYGLYAQSVEFPVVSASDAIRKANRLVANGADPRTVTNPVTVELGELSTGLQGGLLSATVGTSVGWLPGASAAGIPGLPEACFIEGWVERIKGQGGYKGRHTMALTLSDVALTRTMQTWADVPAARTWAGVGASVTWYQVAGTPIT